MELKTFRRGDLSSPGGCRGPDPRARRGWRPRPVLRAQEVTRCCAGSSQSRGAAGGSGLGFPGQPVDVDVVAAARTSGGL